MTDPAAESRLILLCARLSLTAQEAARVGELAAGPLDWERVLGTALRNGVAGLLHRHLSSPAVRGVPRRTMAALWAHAQRVARRNREMCDELVAVAAALDASRVPFIPHKGPMLADEVYADPCLREFGDLDLLVAQCDIPRAAQTLAQRGYRPMHGLTPERERLWLGTGRVYELPLADAARGFLVELQWRANPDVAIPDLDDPRWWASVPWRDLHGHRMRTLPREEGLMALLVHGTKHRWSSLDWLVDVAEMARCRAPDWDRVMSMAREHRAVRRACLGLALARELLQAPLPDPVAAFVDESGVAGVAAEIAPGILASQPVDGSIGRSLRDEIALLDDSPSRLRRVAAVLRPTPMDWQRWNLPRGLWFLYWPLRPLRLAAKYLSPRSPRTRPAASPRTPPPQPHSTN